MYPNTNQQTAVQGMQRKEMAEKLVQNHQAFISFINALGEKEFTRSTNGKWTAGQQLQHILLAVKPLNQALYLPPFMLRLLFGKANRPSKSFDGLVQKYKAKLEQGGRASGRFVPKAVVIQQRAPIAARLQKSVQLLSRQVVGFSEDQLDSIILPHPLLGKVTLREMIYFTIYHVQHHHEATKRNLE